MRPPSNEVKIERDVPVTAADGVVLLTDVYHPVGVDDAPTVLERTPYGRQGVSGFGGHGCWPNGGYRYVVQASRGTDGSGGVAQLLRRGAGRPRHRGRGSRSSRGSTACSGATARATWASRSGRWRRRGRRT